MANLIPFTAAFAADWVRLLPRDPSTWADLDSIRTDSTGLVRLQLSRSGNPARRQNFGAPMRFINKAIDCKLNGAVYDVDLDGKVMPHKLPSTSYERILERPRDVDLETALFNRVCSNRTFE